VGVFIKTTTRRSSAFWVAVCAAGIATGAFVPRVAAQVPPDEAWRTLTTEHFRVTFPDRLEDLGRRAAWRAEEAYAALSESFVDPPGGRIDLLVTDHADISNGYAGVNPSNRITVFARPPVDNVGLGFVDEWMQLVITHELAHIFHLDRTGTLGRLSRSVFGRSPNQWPFFPGLAMPRWTIEGLATWYESRLSDAGRVKGTYQEMVLRTAVVEGRFETLDQASGESPMWPGGNRSYVYGSMFFDHLLSKYGEERLTAFVEAAAGQWVPYRLNAAGMDAFGVRLSDEWRVWVEENRLRYGDIEARLAAIGPVTSGEGITSRSRVASYPRVSPDGDRLAYARSDGRSDPQVRLSEVDGSDARQLARTGSLPTLDWLPDGSIVFSHLEPSGPYRTFADLVVVDADGRRRRVTEGARLTQPSAGPDGLWVVAVQEGEGTNALVRVDLQTGGVTPIVPPAPDVHWAYPSVSPDGRWVAASRWTPGAFLDVVVLEAGGGEVLRMTHDRAMDLAPAWSPDGRTLLWSSDRTGILNIVAASVDPEGATAGPVRMVTNTITGADQPSVDPSGTWLFYAAYHVDGWEVERLPYDPGAWPLAREVSERFATTNSPPLPESVSLGEALPYSPFPTLWPRFWEPLYRDPVTTPAVETAELSLRSRQLLGPAIGAQTRGEDLVGRHEYEAFTRVFTDGGGKADGGISYSWAGLGNPVLSLALQQRWDDNGVRLGQLADTLPLDTLFVLERDRTLSAAATFRRETWRSSLALSLSGGMRWESRDLLDNNLAPSETYVLRSPTSRLSDFGVTLSYATARRHVFQLGRAKGFSARISARALRHLSLADTMAGRPGQDRSVDQLLSSLSGYVTVGGPGYAPHVLALRVSGGYAAGPGADAGYFGVGGASGTGERITGMGLFGGSSIFFPVRGYRSSTRAGRFAWSVAAEYRAPLAMFHRGLGSWPVHLGRVSGTLFADAGNAWGPELAIRGFNSPRRATLASVGVEITLEVLTLWNIDSLLRVGLAAPLVEGSGAVGYLRLGLPF
jgi:Tol biopolymer transport system component